MYGGEKFVSKNVSRNELAIWLKIVVDFKAYALSWAPRNSSAARAVEGLRVRLKIVVDFKAYALACSTRNSSATGAVETDGAAFRWW